MKLKSTLGVILLPAVLLSTSCSKEIRDEGAQDSIGSAARSSFVNERMLETDLLKDVRNATARFHSTTQAIMAGYEPDDHCVSVPGLGGMGYHWVNPGMVDPVYDPMKPEVMLYASAGNGKLRLVAIEYIVINVGQPAPMFGGQSFVVGGTPVPVPHWSLHVWLYENNPSGMFIPFNPNITCP